jgi:GNAT superfamily N-acetyltransferase
MIPVQYSTLREVNSQFIAVCKMLADKADASEVLDFWGLVVAWSNRLWPILNAITFSTPVHNADDLESRIQLAMGYAHQKRRTGTLLICQDWLPKEIRPRARQIFEQYGLSEAFNLKGMIANDLLPARRPLPDIIIRPVKDRQTRCAVADLNTMSYAIPQEWGREALDYEKMWSEGVIGYVGYIDREPVTCACVYLLDNCQYLGLVATHPSYRRRGYAEAIIRFALDRATKASGRNHSVLHATPSGYPLYTAMGYRAVGTFTAYRSQFQGHNI